MHAFILALAFGSYDVTVVRAVPKKSYEVSVVRAPKFAAAAVDVGQFACKIRTTNGIGSGVKTERGVLTCYHVIAGQNDIQVTCGSETGKASILAANQKADLALLLVNWKSPHPSAKMSDSEPSCGENLVSAGRCKDGTISVENHGCLKQERNEIKFENASNSGRSGSGIFNGSGELVGIVTGNSVDVEPYTGIAVSLTPIKAFLGSSVSRPKESYAAYQPVFVDGRNTDDAHLMKVHGVNPETLKGLTQNEKNHLHGKMHPELQPRMTAKSSSPCPGGVCPTNIGRRAGRRGLFR